MSRSFDGIDDVISNTATTSVLNSISSLSIVVSVYPLSAGEGGFGRISRKRNPGTPNGNNSYWELFASATIPEVRLGYSTAAERWTWGSGTYGVSKWNHLAFASADIISASVTPDVWINGSVFTPTAAQTGGGTRVADDSNFYIGDWGDGARTFDGLIANLHIFSRKIVTGEVQQMMFYPGSIRRNLVGFWPLWGSTSPEPDLTGNGNNGTISGAIKGLIESPVNGIFTIPQPQLTGAF